MRLSVKGESFMLHQIRNMVGAAVAVARGAMPPGLLAVALSAPGRVTVPRAPPHTLLLSDNEFSPFARAYGDQPAPALARLTGDALSLREGGRAAQEEFRRGSLNPAVASLLEHPDWAHWRDEALPRYRYDAAECADAVSRHAAWLEALRAQRAEAAAAKRAAEAAEAEARAEAAAAEAASSTTREDAK